MKIKLAQKEFIDQKRAYFAKIRESKKSVKTPKYAELLKQFKQTKNYLSLNSVRRHLVLEIRKLRNHRSAKLSRKDKSNKFYEMKNMILSRHEGLPTRVRKLCD